MLATPLGKLRIIGWLEGLSWLLLLAIAMPLKYFFQQPMPVKIVGWVHGILFIAYLVQLCIVQFKYKWPFKMTVLGVLAAFFPFGTWIYDAKLKKQNYQEASKI